MLNLDLVVQGLDLAAVGSVDVLDTHYLLILVLNLLFERLVEG